ncbi:MAG: hypothetical protein EBT07_10330 [Actinobacteria bacterium]|nr:hypothetical protein [Actinomycetota bacterium]
MGKLFQRPTDKYGPRPKGIEAGGPPSRLTRCAEALRRVLATLEGGRGQVALLRSISVNLAELWPPKTYPRPFWLVIP